MIKIRKARKEDFEEWYRLNVDYAKEINAKLSTEALKYKVIKSELKKSFPFFLKNKEYLLFFLDDGKRLQGFLYTKVSEWNGGGFKYKEAKVGYINNVFISKEYRGQGYFSKFFKVYFKYLKSKKINYCYLGTDLLNKEAIRIYESLKFKRIRCDFIRKL